MIKLQKGQLSILPMIEQILSPYQDASYEVVGRDILIQIKELSYSFSFTYFEQFGWQAFLIHKESILEEERSHHFYKKLQSVANTYNETVRVYEKPEDVVFP